MPFNIRNTGLTILAITLVMLNSQSFLHAEDKVSMTPEINIESDCSQSEAELIIRISIAKGTSIDTQAELIGRLMSFYKGFWKGTDPIIERIKTSQKHQHVYDLGISADAVQGVDAIMSVSRAYDEVTEQGLIFFPDDVLVISKERFPLTFDCLIENGDKQAQAVEPDVRVQMYSNANRNLYARKQIDRNLNNIAVSLVSFRSEFSRFPIDFTELKESNHFLISIKNPFSHKTLNLKGETGPGTIHYSRPSEGKFILTVYDECNMPVRREFFAGPDNSVRGVLSLSKPSSGDESQKYTELENIVRTYTFQIDQLINSYYEKNHYLPKSIAHIQAQEFASVDFINPFTRNPVEPVIKMNQGSPGKYWYWLYGENEYVLVGYGYDGRKVFETHRKIVGNLK